jgi:hypothetical protein
VGFDLLHYPYKRVIADGFWNSVGQGDRDIYKRKGRGNEKAAEGNDKSP